MIIIYNHYMFYWFRRILRPIMCFSNVVGSSAASSKRFLPGPFTPKSTKLFVVTPDAKHVVYGGLWDNSLRAFSIAKNKIVTSVVRHFAPITCLGLDSSGSRHVISGSRDTTSVVWEVGLPVGASSSISLRPIQVKRALVASGNTKGGSITVPLTSCLTGLESAVWQLTVFVFICKTGSSKQVKQEVNGTVILPLKYSLTEYCKTA